MDADTVRRTSKVRLKGDANVDKEKVLEMLRCALVNCDNVKHLGSVGVDILRMQIQTAIDLIEDKEDA